MVSEWSCHDHTLYLAGQVTEEAEGSSGSQLRTPGRRFQVGKNSCPPSGSFLFFNNKVWRSSRHGAGETNLTRYHEILGSIPGLSQWVKDRLLL